jgi:hypothetical protein
LLARALPSAGQAVALPSISTDDGPPELYVPFERLMKVYYRRLAVVLLFSRQVP